MDAALLELRPATTWQLARQPLRSHELTDADRQKPVTLPAPISGALRDG